ncbi:MAG: ABC transporter permease [Eubacterium sp.]|nr:ABC transporter permease [Eubacterium sp.]
MLRFIFTKIINKYKLYIALMAGVISIIAISSVIMMLRQGSLDRIIQSEFQSYYENNNRFPAKLEKETAIDLADMEDRSGLFDEVVGSVRKTEGTWDKYLKLPVLNDERYVYIKGRNSNFSYRERDAYIEIGCFDEDYNGKHFSVVDGCTVNDAKDVPEGYYPCMVSRYTVDIYNLVVGETVTMTGLGETEDDEVKFIIVGIIEEAGVEDYYWEKSLAAIGKVLFIDKKAFDEIVEKNTKIGKIYVDTYRLYDYRKINCKNVRAVKGYLKEFKKKDTYLAENISTLLKQADPKQTSAKAILYAISIPLILLVIIFISMISVRIVNSEQGEIAMLHSRGVTRIRIFGLYVIQSFIIVIVALLPGLILGYGLGLLIASVTGFLDFSTSVAAVYVMNTEMVLASFLAAGVCMIVMLIPVISRSKNTVVENKSKRVLSGTPFWEKCFIDVILLVLSIYLLYGYMKQQNTLRMDVLSGRGIDPMIFIDSTLFLLSCGLLILRLMSYLVRLIFKIGKNRFSPSVYAAFMQIIRTRKGAGTISVFLVLTIAMSIFDANMGRTINSNQEQRIVYDTGADVVINEKWKFEVLTKDLKVWRYTEPDFAIYEELVNEGMAKSITKVVNDKKAVVQTNGGKNTENCTLLGINPKEFGNTSYLQPGVTSKHWFNSLNALSQSSNGVIISKNLADKYDIKIGDIIYVSRYSPAESDYIYATTNVNVIDIIEAFPTFSPYLYQYNDNGELVEKENYLVVANFTAVVNTFQKRPYEIWLNTDHSAEEIEQAVLEKMGDSKRTLRSVEGVEKKIEQMKASSTIKITNGLFTLSFLVALILCVLGYLIHWITSIRDRELLFGIYRAMGISMGEINRMLSLEQLFMSLGPVLAGVGAGTIATILFAKIYAVVYLPEKHAIKLLTYVSGADMIRLGVIIGGAMIACFIIIRTIIKKLKITEALKLGED